ncbi:MAG: peptidoglycan editing factor PgeF [Deltaproteobacteria bacterium]|nr:peptidoglycan editing factor PgeF [Deltaproteobacteria bacterium]MBW2196741.1 peptidoglycan editing factor PgeF [Deltaproteobacteria bacterium]MBW2555417.1 peptidoglycan editing factor PgeF [Deltaproteobacteria bacterium]
MIVNQNNEVPFLEFRKISSFSGIRHGIFTRNSGTSIGPYRSLNVSFGVGDEDRNVIANRKIISQCINEKDLVFLNQVHGNRTIVFEKNRCSYTVFDTASVSDGEYSEKLPKPIDNFHPEFERRLEGDAMVTNIPQKFLVIQVADCQSVLIYDPVQQVVANVHSGWRGSISNIIGQTLQVMEKSFGCRAHDIVAGVGPSLGPCCAEFVNYEKEIPKMYWKYRDNNNHFDFWAISCDQFSEAGIPTENVELSRLCTKCDSKRFFSYRKEGTTGRFAALIGLK